MKKINKNKPNIIDIGSWEDHDFTWVNKRTGVWKFMTISDFIATCENHEQEFFNVIAHHRYDSSPLEIEINILRNAIETVGFREDDEEDIIDDGDPLQIPTGKSHDLTKLSSCTHYIKKYDDFTRSKIKKFLNRQNGKWWFQPDQRCFVVESEIDRDPRIASEVLPFSEWKKQWDNAS